MSEAASGLVGQQSLDGLELQLHRGERRTESVVQVPPDPTTLLLSRSHQLRTRLLHLHRGALRKH